MCLMSYANNKGADPRSLISAFVVRCLDSIKSLDSIAEISRLYLASEAAQFGLCLAWSETPEDTLCQDEAHIYFCIALCCSFVVYDELSLSCHWWFIIILFFIRIRNIFQSNISMSE